MTAVRRHAATLAALAMLAGTTAACGGDDSLTLNGQPIDDPGGFLQRAESTWRGYLAGKRVTIAKDARCYFMAPTGSREVRRGLICGPVRRLLNDSSPVAAATEQTGRARLRPSGGYWDTMTFDTVPGDDGVRPSRPTMSRIGVTVPRAATLLRPDGEKPETRGASLSAPPARQARPNLLVTDQELKFTRSHRRSEPTRIVTPRYVITVESAGTIGTVQTEHGIRSAARGQRFVGAVIHVSNGPQGRAYRPDSPYHPEDLIDATPTFQVRAGSVTRRVSWNLESADHSLAISADRASHPTLLVTVAGRTQIVSLVSGHRRGPALPGYYQRTPKLDLSKVYPTSRATDGDFDISHSIRFTDAELTGFHPTLGWPGRGKSWLIVNTDERQYEWDDLYSITVDHADSASVTDAAGHVSTDATPSQTQDFFIPSELIQLAFRVDADQRTFDLTYRPQVRFRSQGPGPDPGRGTVRLSPMHLSLRFADR